MADLRPAARIPDGDRRRAIERALSQLESTWTPLAAQVLAADHRIDWVGHDGRGRLVLVLCATESDTLPLIGQALAHQAWLFARIADWAQLVPAAGLRSEAGITSWLIAPEHTDAARSASHSVASQGIRLAEVRFAQNGSGLVALLEALGAPRSAAAPEVAGPAEDAPPGHEPAGSDSPFRTGLSAEDLGLSAEEYAEFEPRR
ncbi:MAG: hypothetical protein AAF430_19745 [Myxococcota bacterium]